MGVNLLGISTHADGNLTKAANLLGISLHTLREKRKKHGLI